MKTLVMADEITELLQALIQAKTVNPPADTRACAGILAAVLDDEGIDYEIVEGQTGHANVVARLRGNAPGKSMILNGHIDVVPPGEGWTVDPFGGDLIDGKLYGRGSCDMKSGVATMLLAMVALKRSGKQFDGEIIFQAVADEESGSLWGTRYLIEQGYCAGVDVAICTEPTSLRVEPGNRGLRWIDVEVIGAASHAGRPQLGINAVSAAAQLISAIDGIAFSHQNEMFEIPSPSISVTTVSGGHTVNVIPDRCEFSIDRRMLPGETEEHVLQEISTAFEPVLESLPDIQVRMTSRPGYWDPYLLTTDEPVVEAIVAAYSQVTGELPVMSGKAACTDASHLYTMAGIPTVLFGPGDETKSHKPDECVPLPNLTIATEILYQTFLNFLGS